MCQNQIPKIWFLNLHYYSFKIFIRFWLAQIQRIIFRNQLALDKFGRRLRYVENDVNGTTFRFWLAQILRIIVHNQLTLHKFGRRLWYVENDVNGTT